MILAIDIGNTNIVLGGMVGKELRFEARMATDLVKTSDQYAMELKNMLELFRVQLDEIEDAIIASVVPQLLNSFRASILKVLRKEPMLVGPGIRTGLNIQMENPRQVGAGLIAGAVAAIQEYSTPLLVVDMDTATTISAIDRRKNLIGGCICPGVQISLDALKQRTAQLPGIALMEPKCAIGRNTIDSMQSGVMFGAAAMLDGMLDRMEAEMGEAVTVVATGEIARYVTPLCRRTMVYDKDLLLKGLAHLYDLNRHR